MFTYFKFLFNDNRVVVKTFDNKKYRWDIRKIEDGYDCLVFSAKEVRGYSGGSQKIHIKVNSEWLEGTAITLKGDELNEAVLDFVKDQPELFETLKQTSSQSTSAESPSKPMTILRITLNNHNH